MSVLYFAGAETGGLLELQEQKAQYSAQGTIKRTGAYAYKASSASPVSAIVVSGLNTSTLYVRFGLYIDHKSTPGSDDGGNVWQFLTNVAGGIATISVRSLSNGTHDINLVSLVNTSHSTGFVAITAGAWHLIEAKVSVSPTAGILELKVDEVFVGSQVSNANTGSTNIDLGVMVTGPDGGLYYEPYWDDLQIRDDAYPGNGKIIARQGKVGSPNADTWTKTSSQTAAQVWSETPYSATNEAHSTDQSQAQTMLAGDVGAGTDPISSGYTINACKVAVIAKEILAASGTPTYSIRRRVNATDTDTAKALTTSDAYYDDGIWTDTLANLQAAEIGAVRGSGVDTIVPVNVGTEGSAASGNVTPGLPASLLANDILICVVHSTDQVAHSMNGTYWSQIQQGNGGGTTSRLSWWWHRYDGSTDPDRVVTHASGDTIVAGIIAYRGCVRTGSPINTSSAVAGGTDATMEAATITPSVDGCMLLHAHGAGDDNNVTQLSGWTTRFEDSGGGTQGAYVSTLGTDGMVGAQEQLQASKAATGTITVTQAASDAWAASLAALTPAAKHMQVEDAWLMVDYTVVMGRASKNTRAFPLGTQVGMGWRMPL